MEKVNIPNEQSAIEERRLKQNWVLSVKQLLSRLGFMDVRFFRVLPILNYLLIIIIKIKGHIHAGLVFMVRELDKI